MKWLLPLSCLLLINYFAMTADTGEKRSHQQININTASTEELIKLPGVGQVLARRIVDFREENGPFKKIIDLMKVKGIGEKNFQKIKDKITVGKVAKKEG